MASELAPLAAAVPRSGQLLTAPHPKHTVSERAKLFWEKLCSLYGASKLDDFGPWPPVEICRAVDALSERQDMAALLAEIKAKHEQWPPTVPQFESIVRKYIAPAIDWGKLREQLTDYVMRTYGRTMTRSQSIGIPRWNWYNDGVWIPPGDGAAGFFVPFTALGERRNG